MKLLLTLTVAIIVTCSGGCQKPMTNNNDNLTQQEFKVYPIGKVVREGDKTMIVIDKKYQPALLGLEKHKHVHVLYWFDKNDTPEKRAVMQVHPRADKNNPLTGVFATHSPFRPNLIATSRCEIIAVKENIIEIKQIDAFDNTPIIDLKGDFFAYYKTQKQK